MVVPDRTEFCCSHAVAPVRTVDSVESSALRPSPHREHIRDGLFFRAAPLDRLVALTLVEGQAGGPSRPARDDDSPTRGRGNDSDPLMRRRVTER
jgi:hypothetical protein